jgi:hypothetical protein
MNLWFNNAVSTSPDDLGNYWQDDACTVPAAGLPNWATDVVTVVPGANMYPGVAGLIVGAELIVYGGFAVSEFGSTLTVTGSLTIKNGGVFSVDGSVGINLAASSLSLESGSLAQIWGVLFGAPPGASDVRDGVAISNGAVGILVLPATTDVRNAVPYGAYDGSWEYEGSYVPEFPDRDNVRAGVDRGDGQTGTIIVPAAEDLRDGVHAGWHHPAGKGGVPPESWEVTGTLVAGGGGGAFPILGGTIVFGARG